MSRVTLNFIGHEFFLHPLGGYVCFQTCVTNIHQPNQSNTGCYGNIVYKMKVEAKSCWILQLTLTYQKFLLCISSQGQDLYSHQKLSMYIYWFSSESGYRHRRWQRCRRRQCRMPRTTTRVIYQKCKTFISHDVLWIHSKTVWILHRLSMFPSNEFLEINK